MTHPTTPATLLFFILLTLSTHPQFHTFLCTCPQGKLLAGGQIKDGPPGGGSDKNFLTFVKGIYSNDWDNFRERVFRMAKRHQASGEPITR